MRVVFIGSSKFGLRCLDAVRQSRACEIAGIVTAPQNFSISYRPGGVENVLYADFATYAREHAWPCDTIGSAGMRDAQLLERVAGWRPDAFIVAGWYHMVPKSWRALAPAYGLHASLLPDYSGGAPLVWAIINGEQRTGITFFQFTDGVDNGPIVGQAAVEIRPDDTIATVYSRIEELGTELLSAGLSQLANGTAQLQVQDEARRRVFPQRSPEDGRIKWEWPAPRVYDFVRAQTRPYPGAFAIFGERRITIWAARVAGDAGAFQPGEICAENEHLFVGCGANTRVEVTELAIDGVDASTDAFFQQVGHIRRRN